MCERCGCGDPVVKRTDGWYFADETWTESYGPFATEAECREELRIYASRMGTTPYFQQWHRRDDPVDIRSDRWTTSMMNPNTGKYMLHLTTYTNGWWKVVMAGGDGPVDGGWIKSIWFPATRARRAAKAAARRWYDEINKT